MSGKRNLVFIGISLVLFALVLRFIFSTDIQTEDYVTVNIESVDKIKIEVLKKGEEKEVHFTFGITNIGVVKPKSGQDWDIEVSVERVTENKNPVYVKILNSEGNTLFFEVFLESSFIVSFVEVL